MKNSSNEWVEYYRHQCPHGWDTGPDDGVFFQQLTYHLRRAQFFDELYTLLLDSPAWMEVKYRVTGSDKSYREDLDLALSDFTDPLDPKHLLLLVRLWAARSVIQTRIAQFSDLDLRTLVWLNRQQQALDITYLRRSPEQKVKSLLAVYIASCEQGKSVDFLDTLKSMTHALINPDESAEIERKIAVAEGGNPATARTTEGPYLYQSNSLKLFEMMGRSPAPFMREAHDSTLSFEVRLEAARAIEALVFRRDALQVIAEDMARQGDLRAQAILDEAFVLNAHRVADTYYSSTVRTLVDLLSQLRRFSQAHELIEQSQHEAKDEFTWCRLAVSYTRAGHIEEALWIIGNLELPEHWARGLIAVGRRLADVNDPRTESVFDLAFRFAKTIESFILPPHIDPRSYLLQDLVVVLVQFHRLDRAVEVVQYIEQSSRYIDALCTIAVAMGKSGDPRTPTILNWAKEAVSEEHRRYSSENPDTDWRAVALCRIGQAMTDLQMPESDDFFDKALARVKTQGWSANVTRNVIAEFVAKTGNFDKARAIAHQIEIDTIQAFALSDIARIAVLSHHANARSLFNESIAIAQIIPSVPNRAQAFQGIVENLQDAGYIEEAMQMIPQMCYLEDRRHLAYKRIANEIVRHGNIVRAFLLRDIATSGDLLETLCEWSPHLEAIQPGISLDILSETLRILAWEDPIWLDLIPYFSHDSLF